MRRRGVSFLTVCALVLASVYFIVLGLNLLTKGGPKL